VNGVKIKVPLRDLLISDRDLVEQMCSGSGLLTGSDGTGTVKSRF
jgi:hypothetical protein